MKVPFAHITTDWISFLAVEWRVFNYNYQWSDHVYLFDGWLAKTSMAIPIVGYLIIFNDTIASHVSFDQLTNPVNKLWLGTSIRLKLIYIGLVFLGVASAVYRIRRPYIMRLGKNAFEYTDAALRYFTISAYIDLDARIRRSGMDPYTQHGKYYDKEFEGFLDLALGPYDAARDSRRHEEGNWRLAKEQYEALLRSILYETYFRENRKRRFSLTLCILFSLFGYFSLSIPSLDVFVHVLWASLSTVNFIFV